MSTKEKQKSINMKGASALSLIIFFFAAALAAPLTSPVQEQEMLEDERDIHDDWEVLSECEYHSMNKEVLIDSIKNACRGIINRASIIHRKLLGPNSLWATVGVYNTSDADSLVPSGHLQLYSAHRSLALSVSIFQSFLRPFGVALMEETLREVVQMEPGSVRKELYDIYDNLAAVATKTYQLIENDINIYGCRIPHLPANTNVTLRPSHFHQDTISKHKIVVDGLVNELRSLAGNVILLIQCMDKGGSSCDFPQ